MGATLSWRYDIVSPTSNNTLHIYESIMRKRPDTSRSTWIFFAQPIEEVKNQSKIIFLKMTWKPPPTDALRVILEHEENEFLFLVVCRWLTVQGLSHALNGDNTTQTRLLVRKWYSRQLCFHIIRGRRYIVIFWSYRQITGAPSFF